jgi:hypothetical protein
MRKVQFVILIGIAALLVGVLPAAAGSDDWGTWTYAGHWKSWHGTFTDSHHVTGFVVGLRSLKKYNSVTSLTIGGKKCDLGSIGTGYCYHVNIPPNTKLKWTLTSRKPLRSSKLISPCIEYAKRFHCRYGNN